MNFRRFFVAFFCFAFVISTLRSVEAAAAHVILDAQTGFVLDQVNGKNKRQIGSLTKVATAMVVLDWSEKRGGDLNQATTIPPEAFTTAGAHTPACSRASIRRRISVPPAAVKLCWSQGR